MSIWAFVVIVLAGLLVWVYMTLREVEQQLLEAHDVNRTLKRRLKYLEQ